MQHLNPQTHINSLISSISENYNASINYYRQRREMFNNCLKNQYSDLINPKDFENFINKQIFDKWQENFMKQLNQIYWGNRDNPDQRVVELEKTFSGNIHFDKLKEAILQKNPQNFYSSLGFVFEDFLATEAINPILERFANFGAGHQNNLISSFVSGALQSESAVVSGRRNIRPDILLSFDGAFLQDSSKNPIHSSGLPIELQGTIKVNAQNALPEVEEIVSSEEILRDFLTKGSFFGFSAKTWNNDGNGKGFMQSQPIMSQLVQVFTQTDDNGNRHPWDIDYTSEYTVYFLSKLINYIVGPTNVAMLTGRGLIWMDTFLSTHMFYMRISIDKYAKGNKTKIFPNLSDSHIYVRTVASTQEGNFKIGSKLHKTKRFGNYLDLSIKI